MSHQNEIHTLIENRAAGMRAGDVDTVIAQYTPDVLAFTLAPPLAHHADEMRDPASLRRWFASFAGPVDYEVRDLRVTVSGDLAFAHSLNRMSAVPAGQSEAFTLWFRSTVCLRRDDGRWLIAHLHDSTPFYMDGTFAAALDLEP
ncbi:SgcJ/EcaC family oxidoreductase [Amycolatopsis endophytica]|uniref:Ketosteroid isomerase-like protein n=1 Tax=Amycolatopsis endophytica TaxID=860233 RepID=A0A853BAB3_9PSEU|nr:nuclear transport factor 2 family protein [Amycolatopsis endophytica]NYI92109.1 ketosteroid isomerase-like protein [Amycolatopsis endophytica]